MTRATFPRAMISCFAFFPRHDFGYERNAAPLFSLIGFLFPEAPPFLVSPGTARGSTRFCIYSSGTCLRLFPPAQTSAVLLSSIILTAPPPTLFYPLLFVPRGRFFLSIIGVAPSAPSRLNFSPCANYHPMSCPLISSSCVLCYCPLLLLSRSLFLFRGTLPRWRRLIILPGSCCTVYLLCCVFFLPRPRSFPVDCFPFFFGCSFSFPWQSRQIFFFCARDSLSCL